MYHEHASKTSQCQSCVFEKLLFLIKFPKAFWRGNINSFPAFTLCRPQGILKCFHLFLYLTINFSAFHSPAVSRRYSYIFLKDISHIQTFKYACSLQFFKVQVQGKNKTFKNFIMSHIMLVHIFIWWVMNPLHQEINTDGSSCKKAGQEFNLWYFTKTPFLYKLSYHWVEATLVLFNQKWQ